MSTLAFIKKKIVPDQANAEVARVVDIIASTILPLEVYVFGSAARGELTDQSDLDILIIMESESEIKAARKAIAKIRPFSELPLDLVWMSQATFFKKASIGGLAQVIQEEGKLMFRSRPHD